MLRRIIFLIRACLCGNKNKEINRLTDKTTIEQYLDHKHQGLPDKLREKFR